MNIDITDTLFRLRIQLYIYRRASVISMFIDGLPSYIRDMISHNL